MNIVWATHVLLIVLFWRKRKAENGDGSKEQLCLSDSNGHAGSDHSRENVHSEKLTWSSGHVHVFIWTN